MMERLFERCVSLLLALCLLAGPALSAARGAETEISISSVGQLEAFARSCSLDTWSRGKTVRLAADLDLGGREFTPIPTFGGTFLGEGHQISGLRITAAGSDMGFFRYPQEGAVVRDLSVAGVVRPGGSAARVGGIVGDNAGAVRNCAFRGSVEGRSDVGGIAGWNRETGEIARALVSGSVTGEESTGGTAGRNLGALLQCENGAKVNTAAPDEDTGMDVEDLALSLEEAPGGDGEGGFLKNHSDTGGVVGWSSGIVYSCRNTGAVGYPHVGYNVGGIAGRQDGHLSGCTNRGEVYGRKDVGGIVGQAEPDVALSPDSGALDRLRRELDVLEDLIGRTLDRAGEDGDGISARLSGIGRTAGEARDHTEDLLDHVSDFVDGNVGSVNSVSAAVTKALDDTVPALEELSDVSGRMEGLARRLEDALDALGDAADGGADVSADAGRAAGIFRRAGEALSAAVRDLRAAADALRGAVVVRDPEAVEAAAADLAKALEGFGSALEQAGAAADALREALGAFPALEDVREVLRGQMIPALKGMGTALRQAGAALRTIGADTGLDWEQVRASLDEAGTGFRGLGDASRRLNEAIGALQTALDGLGGLSGELGGAVRELADAASLAAPVGRGLERAFDILRDAVQGLAEDGPTQLTPLGEAARDAGRGLFDSLADLSLELEDLHSAVDRAGDRSASDLRAISRQFNTVSQVLLDALADVRDGADSAPREILEDTSNEDIAATRFGKVENCRNEAAVDGDRNVGGIVGAMSIEYGLDPEGDLELSLGGTYETKAVLQSCVNHGAVTAKKDCAGGLAGRMDLGTALGCEDYGPVSSASGSYVGGVAGFCDGVIRESFAKCALSGADDIGGIAGWAGRVWECRAIVTVLEGTERVGAIAGSGDLADIRDNAFIDTGVAGIDGVSYAGIAEPMTFEALRALPDVPAEFAAFTLTLKADGETVKEIPFTYGQDLSKIQLPPVPELEGFYGVWPEFDVSGRNSDIILEAVYAPWVTLVASEEREGPLALALAEGRFTEEAVLRVQSPALNPDVETVGVWWEVSLRGTDLGPEDAVTFRLLNTTGGKAEVREFRDGRGETRLDAEVNGSYLIVTIQGTAGTFHIVPAQGDGALWLALAAAVLLVLPAVLRVRKRKKKAAAKAPAKAPAKG